MVGNFIYIDVFLCNQLTDEQVKLRVRSNEEYDQAYEKYDELLTKDDCWLMVRAPYVKCACNRLVECGGFTNTCDCGRDYNFSGTELANRSLWGE
ncbi:hypothetical protein [Bacillus sp. AFS040349]|uniref:hypothetical protein n=1 Tax=Bacillus sp. AFS040349 TaxID=2033502 RepID=UPI000BFD6A66|nr:hypothetical protein [Bacillus sp. AFS040349]PGT83259.1 hypothetical protein COD11_13065 [Bacillus sp. AFS040349]